MALRVGFCHAATTIVPRPHPAIKVIIFPLTHSTRGHDEEQQLHRSSSEHSTLRSPQTAGGKRVLLLGAAAVLAPVPCSSGSSSGRL